MSIAERREYQREQRAAITETSPEFAELLGMEPACRECGCSDHLGCEDGCWWVQADLCNLCAAEPEGGER